MPVQPFTPPPAREGWEYLRVGVDEASFRAQMEPCFRKYRCYPLPVQPKLGAGYLHIRDFYEGATAVEVLLLLRLKCYYSLNLDPCFPLRKLFR